ncbi:hypothetical protein [Marinitenerispora sediminis]|uniref:ABC transporter substrate-binding protein n=1 Tax=Marinitenerispora sediminis TaxID=1931232 RepID=A0A368TBD9_9ACTN|nr:hypothetical protein [Marinitenerispora sediminis]RCV57107.1 hypothetical protein DEF28_02255 [Marinitenerispora sediminis]RCV58899.1 hypothetical protein DEF23_07980 [Marinitenerispora sediminis]RCV62164.1 hypothetical protein DEF24_02175 [Marinitenerispora sediminis]
MLKKICAVTAISAAALLGSALPASAEDSGSLTTFSPTWQWWLAEEVTQVSTELWDWVLTLAEEKAGDVVD